MSDKTIKRFILFSQYFPSIFLWVLVPQLAYLAGTGQISAINTFETRGLIGLFPIPTWTVIAALLVSGIIASIKELPIRIRAIPVIVVSLYGITVATNFSGTDLAAASMLGATYVIGCTVSFTIIWTLSPVISELLKQQIAIREDVVHVSEHIIKLENMTGQNLVSNSKRTNAG